MPQKRPSQILSSESVGDLEETHSKAFSANHSAKRLKGPMTPPLSSSICSAVVAGGLSRPSLDITKAKTVLLKRADFIEATDGQLGSDRPRTLRSPFEYTRELINSQVNSSAREDTQRFDPEKPSPNENSLRYIYFAPTNPSDTTVPVLDAYRMVPRRQLSYGAPRSRPGPRSLHKSSGSWELRHEAERHAENHNLETRSNSILNAPTNKSYHSEHVRSKPRLWLDLSEQKDDIQEAVSIRKPGEPQRQSSKSILMVLKHIVTIRASPSKPQVICTPRRGATIDPYKTTTPVCPNQGFSIHTRPPTPASSVVDFGIGPVMDTQHDELCETIKLGPTWSQTPPSSNFTSTDTVRRVPSNANTPVRADVPRSTAHDQPQLSELASWILMGLEASVAGISPVKLRLDSPVILQICLPAEQRRVPVKKLSVLSLGRSSFNGPLSSHPTHTSFDAEYAQISPISPTNTRSLSIIFPYASSNVLSSLQATYIALHYISTIHLSLPYTETYSPLSHMPYIPAKARAMLGLQTPTTRPGLPACWMQEETRGWWERIENLERKLRGEVVRLIRLCEGSDLGENEALVRAVGQVVEFGRGSARRSS